MGMGRNKSISDDDLLAAARRVFVEQGYAASTREIARRAGVSEGLIFQRFQTKEDLSVGGPHLPAFPDQGRPVLRGHDSAIGGLESAPASSPVQGTRPAAEDHIFDDRLLPRHATSPEI